MSIRKIQINEVPPPFLLKPVTIEGIVRWDVDNAYPTRMERLIDASVTAKASANMLSRFIVGKGFKNKKLNEIVIGKDRFGRDVTLLKGLGGIAMQKSYYDGYFIRIGYNGLLEIDKLKISSAKDCRFNIPDTAGHPGKVVLYNNWDKQIKSRYIKAEFIPVDLYNTNETVIEAQINAAGGFQDWNGQMFFDFGAGDYLYPISPIDEVQYDADTEKQISIFKNGELRRGFFLKNIIHHTAFDNKQDAEKFQEGMKNLTGAGHNVSNIVLEGEFDPETGKLKDGPNVKVEKVEQNINDKLFSAYERSTMNNIRKAYYAIPLILIEFEQGKLGTTSGEAFIQSVNFYNAQTKQIRMSISENLSLIFKNWKDPIEDDFEIEPLSLIDEPIE
jgi:hypothetical protein